MPTSKSAPVVEARGVPPSAGPRKAGLFLAAAFLALAGIQNVVHDWFVDSRVRDIQKNLHSQVINGKAPAPIQYRILVHYAAEGLIRAGFSFENAFGTIRFVFTFSVAALFYLFLRDWFAPAAAFGGVLWLFAVLPLTYVRYYFQPMDIPNLFFFTAGLLAAQRRNYAAFLSAVVVGMFNRETAVLLVPVWLFIGWDREKNSKLVAETLIAGSAALGIYAVLRKFFEIKPYYSDLFYLGFNLSDARTYVYAVLLFGPLLLAAFHGISSKPFFMRRALLIAPFFVIIHYTMTIMIEPRLWLPMLPVFMPLGLWSAVPEHLRRFDPARADREVSSARRKKNIIIYGGLLAAFTAFFAGFYSWYERAHLGDRRDYELSERILRESSELSSGGWHEEAASRLEKGASLFKDNAEFRYRLALIYAYRVFDDAKALENFRAALEKDPYHLDRERIKAEISRLEHYSKKR